MHARRRAIKRTCVWVTNIDVRHILPHRSPTRSTPSLNNLCIQRQWDESEPLRLEGGGLLLAGQLLVGCLPRLSADALIVFLRDVHRHYEIGKGDSDHVPREEPTPLGHCKGLCFTVLADEITTLRSRLTMNVIDGGY